MHIYIFLHICICACVWLALDFGDIQVNSSCTVVVVLPSPDPSPVTVVEASHDALQIHHQEAALVPVSHVQVTCSLEKQIIWNVLIQANNKQILVGCFCKYEKLFAERNDCWTRRSRV